MTCPRNLILSVLNLHLSRLSVTPASTRHLISVSSLSSCSSRFLPWTKTSLVLHSTPSNPWRIWFVFFWNFSEPELIPEGRTLKENQPHGVMNVVGCLDSHASFICQNSGFASSFEKTLQPANLPRVVSTAGSGSSSLLTYSFSLLRSTQTLTLPLLFGATTMGAHQSVGSSTLDMTLDSNILFDSSFVFWYNGNGTSFTLLSDRDLPAFAQCPTLENLIHLDSLPGHRLFGWGGLRHLEHCVSGFFSVPLLGLGGFFGSFGLVLASFPAPLEKQSTGGCSDLFSCRKVCCFFTVSDCLALITAFSKVSLGSSCSFSESFLSFKPTTILSRIRSSLNVPNSHYSGRQYKPVMKLITDSLSCWLLELNLALSKITFLLMSFKLTFHDVIQLCLLGGYSIWANNVISFFSHRVN